MHPKHIEESTVHFNRLIDKTARHIRAKQATSVEVAMDELRPEITELAQNLITAALVRHANQESDEAIAENMIDILRRVDFQIIQDILWQQEGFWYRLSSLLMTEAIEPSVSEADYPAEESISIEYDVQVVQRQILNALEIVKKELQSDIR